MWLLSQWVGAPVVGGFNKTPKTEPKLAPVSGEELQGRKRETIQTREE